MARRDRREIIATERCLSALTPEEAEQLAGFALVQDFPAGTLLHEQGMRVSTLYVILEGEVELLSMNDGPEDTFALVGPGGMFSWVAMVTDTPAQLAARTATPATLMIMPADLLRGFLGTNALFCRAVLGCISHVAMQIGNRLRCLKRRNAQERLALWLIEHADPNGVVPLKVDKRTLASLIGASPESLSRSLAAVEPYLRRLNARTYQIVDVDRLREIARPIPGIGTV